MDGFTKIPNEVFKLNISAIELGILVRLIAYDSYFKFKGKEKDGWFTLQKKELMKKCGLNNKKYFNSHLDILVEIGVIEIVSKRNSPSKFKIKLPNATYSDKLPNATYSDSEDTDKVANDTLNKLPNATYNKLRNAPYSKNNIDKNNKQDINTINNPDNFNQDKEVNKQNLVIEEKEDIKETNVDKEDITPVTMSGKRIRDLSEEEIYSIYKSIQFKNTFSSNLRSMIYDNSKFINDFCEKIGVNPYGSSDINSIKAFARVIKEQGIVPKQFNIDKDLKNY